MFSIVNLHLYTKTMTGPPHSLVQVHAWLDAFAKGNTIMPARAGGKIPMFRHKNGEYSSSDFYKLSATAFKHGALIILRSDSLLVVDVDDESLAADFMRTYPEFNTTVSTRTSKGYHFYFRATDTSRAAGLRDGARQFSSDKASSRSSRHDMMPIDIKMQTTRGTGGVISIPPSPSKQWCVAPFTQDQPLTPPENIPDAFVRYLSSLGSSSASSSSSLTAAANNETPPATLVARFNTPTKKTTLTAQEFEKVRALCLTGLSARRSASYDSWIRVGMALFNTEDSSRMLDLWDAFSRRSLEKWQPGVCASKWETFGSRPDINRTPLLTIASIYTWEKEDAMMVDADELRRVVSNVAERLGASHLVSTTDGINIDVLHDNTETTGSFLVPSREHPGKKLRLSIDYREYLAQLIAHDDEEKQDTILASRYLNADDTNSMRLINFDPASVHCDLHSGQNWHVIRPAESRAVFKASQQHASIELLNLNQPGRESAKLSFADNRKMAAINKSCVHALREAYRESVAHAIRSELGITWLTINIVGNTFVNNGDKKKYKRCKRGDSNNDRTPDTTLVRLLLTRCDISDLKFYPCAGSGNKPYYCTATNVFIKLMAGQLHAGMFTELYTAYSWDKTRIQI